MRAAVLLTDTDTGTASIATIPAMGRIDGSSATDQLSLLGAQLAMPYYSFGNKFGRITKE
jgi:hypothetical protein